MKTLRLLRCDLFLLSAVQSKHQEFNRTNRVLCLPGIPHAAQAFGKPRQCLEGTAKEALPAENSVRPVRRIKDSKNVSAGKQYVIISTIEKSVEGSK